MDYKLEIDLVQSGYAAVCGVDEAGCGPLAGPVCAAAVILNPNDLILGLDDSKKLSEKQRESLFPEIVARVRAFGIAFASVEEIETMNILQARLLAMRRAVAQMGISPDCALVDGDRDPCLGFETKLIKGGDALYPSIGAASILAKVSRDRLMTELACRYPQYQFDVHKGYGTKLHRELILQYGPCEIHRRSFLKKLLGETR